MLLNVWLQQKVLVSIALKSILLSIFLLSFGGILFAQNSVTFTQTATSFFYPLGKSTWNKTGGTWLGRDAGNDTDGSPAYSSGFYHLGVDMPGNVGDNVFAISNGRIVAVSDSADSWGTGNKAILVVHTLSNGVEFLAVYGHIVTSVKVGDRLAGGVSFATIGSYPPGGNHLHFSVISDINQRGNLGRAANSDWSNKFKHLDPVNYITTNNPKCGDGTSQLYRPNNSVLSHPDGTLLKKINDPTVYVKVNGQIRAIPSASRLYELYGPGRGFDFRDVIMISDEEFATLTRGADVNAALSTPTFANGSPREPDGRLIKQRSGSEIAIVSNGQRRPFSSGLAMLGRGYQLCNVALVDNYSSYPLGSPIN